MQTEENLTSLLFSLVTDQLVLEGDTGFVFNIWLAHIVW